MLKRTRELLTRSLNAFFSENAELALTVFELDDEIDTIWQDGFYKISEYCRQDPEHAEDYMQLLLMMKNIEKIADYASAFAKETIYCVEGVYYRNTEELKAQSEASGSGEAAPQHN
jgi:phosphate transport system protein